MHDARIRGSPDRAGSYNGSTAHAYFCRRGVRPPISYNGSSARAYFCRRGLRPPISWLQRRRVERHAKTSRCLSLRERRQFTQAIFGRPHDNAPKPGPLVFPLALARPGCADLARRPARPAGQSARTRETSVKAAAERIKSDRDRPIYHLLPPAYWNNDPNGPVYFKGKHHLFYQCNPYGDTWGNMHWGHFRSSDLVHWEDMPIALWPSKDKGEDHVFSGCAAITNKKQVMLIYTSIGPRLPEQWAAIPEDDELIKWKKHPANPILTEKLHGSTKVYEWRDPFVFSHLGRTYLVCGGNLNEGKGGGAIVNAYRALNDELTAWKYLGVLFQHPDRDVKNIECPLFFPLGSRWVLIVSQGRPVQYFVGDLDATTMRFKPASRGIMDLGNYYAPNCCLDGLGRRILWGWVPDFPTGKGWNGCLTLPRVLTLEDDGSLGQTPAPELVQLRGERFSMSDVALEGRAPARKDTRRCTRNQAGRRSAVRSRSWYQAALFQRWEGRCLHRI